MLSFNLRKLQLAAALSATVAFSAVLSPWLHASGGPVPALEAMEVVGEARMQVLFWQVYDARLFSPEGRYSGEAPFALSLTYLRELDGERIAERSVEEIRKQGFRDEVTLARWFELLRDIIPDVGEDDEIVGVADASGHTRFYLNGSAIGVVPEPEFTRRFFDIWLGERSSEPAFRDRLLGMAS
jgi:hypothetical protein